MMGIMSAHVEVRDLNLSIREYAEHKAFQSY